MLANNPSHSEQNLCAKNSLQNPIVLPFQIVMYINLKTKESQTSMKISLSHDSSSRPDPDLNLYTETG